MEFDLFEECNRKFAIVRGRTNQIEPDAERGIV